MRQRIFDAQLSKLYLLLLFVGNCLLKETTPLVIYPIRAM
jgi:hypothetical protein